MLKAYTKVCNPCSTFKKILKKYNENVLYEEILFLLYFQCMSEETVETF